MKTRYIQAWRTTILASGAIYMLNPVGIAGAVDISNTPMFITGRVDPNVMLMVDNSGSMSNIVPDNPYNPNTVYLSNCPNSNRAPTNQTIENRIVSSQPRIRYGNNNYQYGTTSGKKCFVTNATYKAKLYADISSGGGTSSYLPAEYKGNYLNWYFNTLTDPGGCTNTWASGRKPCAQSRMMIAKTAAKTMVDTTTGMRLGLATYNGDTGGSLREVVGDLDAIKRTNIKTKIDELAASGSTPLAETLSDIGRYFTTGHSGSLTLHPGQGNQSTASINSIFNNHSIQNSSGVASLTGPVQYFCQKNFAVLLTDGRPQQDRNISTSLCDYDGDSGGSCTNYDQKAGQTYESAGSDYLDDVAQALYEMDLRPDVSVPTDASGDPVINISDKNNLATFTVGFADDQVINDPLMQDTATQGGGRFIQAADSASLTTALDDISKVIAAQTPSAAALSANSTSIQTGTLVYQAKFNSQNWSGQLLAIAVQGNGDVKRDADGNISPEWDASLLIPVPASRNIITASGDLTVSALVPTPVITTGKTFTSCNPSNLNSVQKAQLDADPAGSPDSTCAQRMAWLRGETGSANFRARTGTVLGDVINSDPAFVKAEDYLYSNLPDGTPGKNSYASYVTANASRTAMIYVGANDGMLHGFRADTGASSPASGSELLAYVPAGVYSNLNLLMEPGYTSNTANHRYFVDGAPTVGDAYLNDANSHASGWNTVLVGGLNAGGKTVYALDVTAPTNFGTNDVLWEFTDVDMGLTYSQPQIGLIRTSGAQTQWVAIFGNGYNSPGGRAYLYIVNLKTGALISKIAMGAATSNGLSTPLLYDASGDDKLIDYVYAGDLLGNLWKIDLTSPASFMGNATVDAPLFSAPANQPITAQPQATGYNGGHMVLFGTGRYLNDDDVTSNVVQSFYGIWDNGTTSTVDRGALQVQTIETETQAFGRDIRITSDETVDYSVKRGWFMDLPANSSPSGAERVVSKALVKLGRVIFTTITPDGTPCLPGGTSWLMELELIHGGRPSQAIFDLNNDDTFDSSDNFTSGDESTPVSSVKSTIGIAKTPVWLDKSDEIAFKLMSGTSGDIMSVKNKGGGSAPSGTVQRVYWLQIR